VDSGGGGQGFFRLDEPFYVGGHPGPIAEIKLYNVELRDKLGGDNCQSLDHLMRLPGTVNWPNKEKRKRGRVPRLASVVEFTGQSHPLAKFQAAKAPAEEKGSSDVAKSKGNEKLSGEVRRLNNLDELAEWEVPDWVATVIEHGDDPAKPDRWKTRSEAMLAVCCSCLRSGVPYALIAGIISDKAWGISAHVIERGGRDVFKYAWRQVEQAREKVEAGDQKFEADKDGCPYANQRNIRLAMAKLDISVRFDSFSGRCLVEGLDGFGTYLDDAAMTRMWLLVEEHFHFRANKDFFWSVVEDLARRNTCHVVVDYLSDLVWDGVPRLDGWMARYLGAVENDYTRHVGWIMLVAAVRRVRQPGCKFDEMVILESPQGKAKSTALAILALRDEWFSDDLPLGSDSKVMIERTQGIWIVEAAELAGMSKRDVEHLKGSLSRRIDRARRAYGRLTEEVPRQFIIIGTTNSDKYLRDSTGNRRFWPVRVGEIDVDALRRDVDQLWAEAALREAEGVSIRMDRSIWEAAAAEQAARQQWDPYQMELYETLGEVRGKIRASDVWRIIGKPVERRTQTDQQRVGDAMKALGFEHRQARFGGPPAYAYVRGEGIERKQRIKVKNEDGNWTAFIDEPIAQQLELPPAVDQPDAGTEPY
jgi:hypothetical protein